MTDKQDEVEYRKSAITMAISALFFLAILLSVEPYETTDEETAREIYKHLRRVRESQETAGNCIPATGMVVDLAGRKPTVRDCKLPER